MESLIPIVNKLRDVIDRTKSNSNPIQLPQIVVVGSQSVGKSSVLERLVGKSFLPRGEGIVTRCPIELRLIHTPGTIEWFEFEHKPGSKFTQVNEVEREIQKKTEEMTGPTNGVSRDKIKLTVYSPNVLTITLIDLPGIVKVALTGQPEDIEQQTTELVKEYISQPNSIILAVSEATVDIANSESLKLAKEFDPQQQRTVAVLTKADLAAQIDLQELISGKTISVKLGIIAVINRSKDDIRNNVSFEETIAKEKDYFETHYPLLASKQGSPHLAERLHSVLLQRIKTRCPGLEIKVRDMLSSQNKKLAALGDSDLDESEQLKVLTGTIDTFAKKYAAQIDGQRRLEIDINKLSGGSKIDFIFGQTFPADLNAFDPLKSVTDKQILIGIKNASAVDPCQNIYGEAINRIVKDQIIKMKPPVMHCCTLVHRVMKDMIENCMDKGHRFPKINEAINETTQSLLEARAKQSQLLLESYLDIQSASAFTANSCYKKNFKSTISKVNSIDLGDLPASYFLTGENDCILSTSNGDTLKFDSKTILKPESNLDIQSASAFTTDSHYKKWIERGISKVNSIDPVDVPASHISIGKKNDCILSTSNGETLPFDSTAILTPEQKDACAKLKTLIEDKCKIVKDQTLDHIPKTLFYSMLYATSRCIHSELIDKLRTPDKAKELCMKSEEIRINRDSLTQEIRDLNEALLLLIKIKSATV